MINEDRVVQLIMEGCSEEEIARHLGIDRAKLREIAASLKPLENEALKTSSARESQSESER